MFIQYTNKSGRLRRMIPKKKTVFCRQYSANLMMDTCFMCDNVTCVTINPNFENYPFSLIVGLFPLTEVQNKKNLWCSWSNLKYKTKKDFGLLIREWPTLKNIWDF